MNRPARRTQRVKTARRAKRQTGTRRLTIYCNNNNNNILNERVHTTRGDPFDARQSLVRIGTVTFLEMFILRRLTEQRF